ncbi:MAG: MmcQ/YjbR family DNA-binding protein [Acidimicrobiia bacterium]|nr:MmcQ/YjbR family DNA-binding protein [Acidimicrobiia bacterium]
MAAEEFESHVAQQLQRFASQYPEVSESPSCVNRSFKARKKGFLFLGEKPGGVIRLMVKLDEGIASAEKVAREHPDEWNVSGPGWITGNFTDESAPPIETMTAWVDESYRLLAPKTLVRQLEN